MKIQKYAAELLGTFVLTLAVFFSLTAGLPLGTAIVAGLTVGLFVYTVGAISGAHFNPAVTIGIASVGKLQIKDAVLYVIFQVIGALLAMLVAKNLTGTVPALVTANTWQVGVGEFIGTFLLAFAVTAVTYKNVPADAAGLTIGGSLALGAMLAGGLSNALLNPAVMLGVGAFSWMYLFAPIAGAVVAAWVFRFLR
ncbi:aquaporin [Candidatus Peregrinibacteria bacterium]|nr:aquaporin [Candidatus Peregrinibacteria bacterium]